MFVDAHCHTDLYKGQELRLALEETRNHNILTLSTSMDPEGYSRALRINRNNPRIIPSQSIRALPQSRQSPRQTDQPAHERSRSCHLDYLSVY